jgi:UDP-glucose 4-epimerase
VRTLVVTGASGFIGRRLVREAAQRGWSVRALTRSSPPREARDNVVFAHWDALDPAPPVGLLAGADVVCHLAAFIPADFQDPSAAETCFRVNAAGALKLAEAASQAGLRRMVYFSSGNAYAPGAPSPTEDHPQRPNRRASYYLMSKVCGEVFVEHWGWSKGLSVCALRLASVYGPGMDERGLLPSFARKLLRREPVTLRDGGRHTADFVHVDDVVAVSLAAAESEATGPFNIASGEATTAAALAEMLVSLTDAPARLVLTEAERPASDPPGFPALDIARARAALAYRPRPLRAGLRDYLDWLSSSDRAPAATLGRQ